MVNSAVIAGVGYLINNAAGRWLTVLYVFAGVDYLIDNVAGGRWLTELYLQVWAT